MTDLKLIQELEKEIKFRKQQLELAVVPAHTVDLIIQLEDLTRLLKKAQGVEEPAVKKVSRIHSKRNLF